MGTVTPVAIRDLLTTDDDGAVFLPVHAQPGAGRTELVGRHGDALKVRVAAPPEAGRANEALLALLAERLGVPAKAVTLASGESSRTKRVRIEGVDADQVADRLEMLLDGDDGPGSGRRGRR
jgi:uncharacterized protein (TIGR00251 family)